MTQRSPKVTCSGRYSDGMSRGKNIQGGVHLQNQWNRFDVNQEPFLVASIIRVITGPGKINAIHK